MIAQASRPSSNFAEIAGTDTATAPLALLHLALGTATLGSAWDTCVPSLERAALANGLPLLHGQTITVDVRRINLLLSNLIDAAAQAGVPDTGTLIRATEGGGLDPLALIDASLRQDDAGLDALSSESDAPFALLATLGHLLALPLLRACGRAAQSLLEAASWDAGYCPVCAAWPTLAERRGLERKRFLRCGRCGAGWTYALQRCVYCGNRDHAKLGYLAPEAQREAHQAATCDACQGYLKSLATFAPLAPDEIVTRDLTTLELDVAALEQGYARPEERGFPLDLSVIAGPNGTTSTPSNSTPPSDSKSGRRWLPWRQ
jgi:FdhE protein